MARKPRIHVAGALYHVILRGNNGQPIFGDDTDRHKLEELIAEGARRFGYCLLGYCWMGNHIHAAIRVGRVSLSTSMHNLSFRYTGYFNWRHQRIGHVFQGRYRAILVDSDSYLLQLIRYIHLNPVRAGIVREPGGWAWSSHRVYLGQAGAPVWLEPEMVLEQFSTRTDRARAAYRRYMGMADPNPMDFKRGNQKCAVLGDELFARRMVRRAAQEEPVQRFSTAEIVAAVCKAAGIAKTALGKARTRASIDARVAIAHLVVAHGDGNLSELARRLGRDASTMSRAAARFNEGADCVSNPEMLARRAKVILCNSQLHA